MADLDLLRRTVAAHDRLTVAFSGGADSAFLAWVAHDTLGPERVQAVTAVSPSLPASERAACAELADSWGLRWSEVHTDELERAAYRRNDRDRCFHCKDALMDAVLPLAASDDSRVALGVNVDDLGDHRPGQDAARARGAVFPLVDAGFSKADVRHHSRTLGLATWDKPAAACLASRLPYGTPVTFGVLATVEQAEAGLRELGFDALRVRHYGTLARLEVPLERLDDVLRQRAAVVAAVRAAGYDYVTLDLEGLRSGNLNGTLDR
jgi:pyridinium-3,5-biscarboxylic acid mononucleotide sulfurtransferase